MEKEHIEYDPMDFLMKATKWKRQDNKNLSFSQAFREVMDEYPEMTQRYQDQRRGLWPPKTWEKVC